MEYIEVEMHGTLANAISEAAEQIADSYVVLVSNDFEVSDYENGKVASEDDSDDVDADTEETTV
jgi:hypothetical protein